MAATAFGQSTPSFEFDSAAAVSEWTALNDVAQPAKSGNAMRLTILGGDPYLQGPARDFPKDKPLLLTVRLRSEQGGLLQVFFAGRGQGYTEARSARCGVAPGKWFEARLRLPSLGPDTRLRLDPPGSGGVCDVAWMRFDEAVSVPTPRWHKPTPAQVGAKPLRLRSGELELVHSRVRFGAFKVFVAGKLMACGNDAPVVGATRDGRATWTRGTRSKIGLIDGSIVAQVRMTAPQNLGWTLTQRLSRSRRAGAIDVETTVVASQSSNVHYLPVLMLHPGLGSFGVRHRQAVFPGLEYLDRDEPSSSEKDLVGEQAQRLVPDAARITLPLMAVQQEGRYLALAWTPKPELSAAFDIPDRQMGGGSHLMGLLLPGSDGFNRSEGSLVADLGLTMQPQIPLTVRATILGGAGASCVAAFRQFVDRFGLPRPPAAPYTLAGYARWAAGGWLDSGVRAQGGLFRHAFWPGLESFGPGAAPDAASFMAWLAAVSDDAGLRARLESAVGEVLGASDRASMDATGVSHVRYPVQSLLFGDPIMASDHAARVARSLLGRFEPDGRLYYRQAEGKPDFGRTHFERDANGLTARSVLDLLGAVLVTGDPQLKKEALAKLEALDRFLNTAPRGAQTWEIPLHTPDILASAHLVRCYTIGYELTGNRALLDQARYWAWTGVPFVYLTPPTDGPIGLYATIAVFGATNWEAPNWMGLPVQWCGLVYSDALYGLARHDPSGIWKRLADGIAVSGMQQSFPAGAGSLQGLLPDSFALRSQTRNPVAINPGTLQASAIRCLGGPVLYDYRVLQPMGIVVHAPGRIEVVSEGPSRTVLQLSLWSGRPSQALVVGLRPPCRASVWQKGQPTPEDAAADSAGRSVLQVGDGARIEVLRSRG